MESVIKLTTFAGRPLGRGSWTACWGQEEPKAVASYVPLVYSTGTGRRNRKSPVLVVTRFIIQALASRGGDSRRFGKRNTKKTGHGTRGCPLKSCTVENHDR